METKELEMGLNVFSIEFVSPHWNISKDGETVIVWDDEVDDCSDVKNEEMLNGLGWHFDDQEKAWSIKSPIY